MTKRAAAPAILASLALSLSACSPSSSPSPGSDESSSELASTTDTGQSSDRNGLSPADPRTPTEATATSSTTNISQVPLTPGVYVLQGTSCQNPANAAWRVWDGKGLSGSSTRACRAAILSLDDKTYTLRNSCQSTYDGSRSDETLAMTVTDQVHFSINGQSFSSCSMAQAPQPLRERVTGDTPINSENYAEVMEARSREYDRLEYKPVNLNSFECGDNCYLELTEGIEGAAPRKVLCTAKLCANWQGEGRLPPRLKNTGAKAKFGKANQVDGAGNVMARDVEAVVDLRL